jgi:two-component system alkaline phosphatase synthesis response regulator PhoP
MIEHKILKANMPAGPSVVPPRILVVEDESDLRQLNAEVLMDSGYQVDVAGDGTVAWAALQQNHYDLLVTDQFVPKLSGVELLKKIHAARLPLPVIMVTSVLPTWEFALNPHLQAATMLHKPYTIAKLLGMVKNVLYATAGINGELAPLVNSPGMSAAMGLRV